MAKARKVTIKLGFDTSQARRDLREVDRDVAGLTRRAGNGRGGRAGGGRVAGQGAAGVGTGLAAGAAAGITGALASGLASAISGALETSGLSDEIGRRFDDAIRRIVGPEAAAEASAKTKAIGVLAAQEESRVTAGFEPRTLEQINSTLNRMVDVLAPGIEAGNRVRGIENANDEARVMQSGGFVGHEPGRRDRIELQNQPLELGRHPSLDGAAINQ